MTEKKSIIPPTGDFGVNWPNNFVLPQGKNGSISVGGWTPENTGFIQQTFLGASIRSFNVSAGFGDTSSTLSVQLVEDEYNKSDQQSYGLGDDPYHNGVSDRFVPPPVGSPVFFKFGKTFATTEQAWKKSFDDLYGYSAYTGVGANHFVFGGILQSYVQNKGVDGSPLYSVQVVDPREILSNASIILNNYAGSIFNNKNYFNVYGFLEYDVSDSLKNKFERLSLPGFNYGPIESTKTWSTSNPTVPYKPKDKKDNILQKTVDPKTGQFYYFGNDMYRFQPPSSNISKETFPEFFPMTGQGFSRRSEQGIPWYRVRQALNALFNYNGLLPQEYIDAGFGGPINFRGFNYVVDFSGIPIEKIPQMYFLEFDQIDLLSLCQELCDIISHDLFISLIPVINHPASKFLYDYNSWLIGNGNQSQIITGVIRVDAIDRSQAPEIGAIKSYLEDLESVGINVENKDLGYELSNITTDKIVAGGQEVEMYFFSGNRDRDDLQFRRKNAGIQDNYLQFLNERQFLLETSLSQQILPFYGFIGKDTVTIPRGFGAYQQIMLDTSGLDAFGVGNYYIATELELRAAAISYERWAGFLLLYNETFMEEIGENKVFYKELNSNKPQLPNDTPPEIEDLFNNREFGVSVPRCVFDSDKPFLDDNGYPASRCSPPFGYPLYYKRAEAIGIPEAGIAKFLSAFTTCVTKYRDLKQSAEQKQEMMKLYQQQLNHLLKQLEAIGKSSSKESEALKELIIKLNEELSKIESSATVIQQGINNNERLFAIASQLSKRHLNNAKKVYNFIKNIADSHLGKKFLVRIPKQCNLFYNNKISLWPEEKDPKINNIKTGPFGFKPLPIYNQQGYYNNPSKMKSLLSGFSKDISAGSSWKNHYLDNSKEKKYTYGALKGNFNPISDQWEFNYKPEPQGGFFNYSIYDRKLSLSQLKSIPQNKLTYVQSQLLAPIDLSNFENGGRISAYVRFDHSETLDFSNIGSENLAQQIITPNGFIPDVLEQLGNTDPDDLSNSFDLLQGRISAKEVKPPSVMFVKCEIDEKLYMVPKFAEKELEVFSRNYIWLENKKPPRLIDVTDENGCIVTKVATPYPEFIFLPLNKDDGFKAKVLEFNRTYNKNLGAYVIDSDKENLDSDYVYAIITLPGRIIPTIDTRFNDGQNQNLGASIIKHLLTQDVTRMPDEYGFNEPAPLVGKKEKINCDNFSLKQLTSAKAAQQKAIEFLFNAGNPEKNLYFSQPSPVYPDLVALPLMSMERCYGPWTSSSIMNGEDTRVRYSDIGGKVEFIKNEELVPWNYAGYQLMNEAGSLQAQFSNSLLLFSERGGFVVPDAPFGVALAKSLKSGGPLVTSISVDIGEKVSTTIRMDLYTSRFGKLQKQKEEAIAKIVRERQKISDQNNLIARQGFVKKMSSMSIVNSQFINSSNQLNSALEKSTTVGDKIILSVAENKESFFIDNQETVESKSFTLLGSVHPNGGFTQELWSLCDDQTIRSKKWASTAGASIPELFTPVNKLPINHQVNQNTLTNMAGIPYMNSEAVKERTLQ